MSTKASDIAESLVTLLKSIAEIGPKVKTVYSPDDLLSANLAIQLPSVGVLYEGMRAVANGTEQMGKSGEIVCSILLIAEKPKGLPGVDTKVGSLNLLDTIRHTVMLTRSPTGHFWRFMVEAPATEVKGHIVWLQRWSCPIQLVAR